MHPLIKFASRNLFKSKIRSGLSILAVFLGVLLITTLLVMTDSLVASVDDSLAILDGVIVVQEKNSIDPTFSDIKQDTIDEIIAANKTGGALDGLIDSYVSEIWYSEKNDEGYFGYAQAIGVTPSAEKSTVGVLNDENIERGRSLQDNDYNATVMGATAAFYFQVDVGDYVKVADRSIEVVGIFFTDSFIDTTMIMGIDLVREFGSGKENGTYSTVLIKPTSLEYGDEIKDYINNQIQSIDHPVEATDFDEIAEQGRKFLEITSDFALYLGLISIVIGSLSVFNSILMSVMERKKEIAILKATGWTDREVGLEVLTESIIISAVGGIGGLVGGVVIAWYVTSTSTFLDLVIIPFTILKSYFYAVVLGIFAGLYPAARAMRIDPVIDIAG